MGDQAMTSTENRYIATNEDIAEEFDTFFKSNGGLITKAYMAAVKPEWAEPLHVTYRGYDVYSDPSSSRGGFELEMALNLVEPYDLAKMGNGSPEALRLEMEAIKISKADIYHYVADDRTTRVPTQQLLSKEFALQRGKLMEPGNSDPDMVEELARGQLMDGAPNQVAIPRTAH